MDPQHPSVPLSATHIHHSQQPQQPSPDAVFEDPAYTYNEKDAYPQLQSTRAERGSKQSSNYGRGRDSVISHPFSPKQSNPPSPSSSISSVDRQKHNSLTEIHPSVPANDGRNVRLPPQAHLDPEKQNYGSSQERRSHRNSGSVRVDDAVYDQAEYHEKAPEEKAWQLLVSRAQTSVTRTLTDSHQVLPLRPLCPAFHRDHSLDICRPSGFARSSATQVLHATTGPLDTTDHVPRTRIKSATPSRIFAQCITRLQRSNACGHPPLFANHCVWRCDSFLDSSWVLVLLLDSRRSRRPRRPQRRQREHSGCPKLVGALALEGPALNLRIMKKWATEPAITY